MPHSRSFYLLLLCLCMLLQHIDIDECADRNMSACSQVCVNSVGSYRCECEKGYFLEEDRKTCTKRERGESSLLSLQFFLFIQGKCVFVLRDGSGCALQSPARLSEPPRPWILLRSDFSGRIRENATTGSDDDRVASCPTSNGKGGGGVTSSHEFIFHYHILRTVSGVENPGCLFVLGYFWLICNIVGKLVHRYFHSSMKLVDDYSGDSSTAAQSKLSALTTELSSAWQRNSASKDAKKCDGILQLERIVNWMYGTHNPWTQSRSSM